MPRAQPGSMVSGCMRRGLGAGSEASRLRCLGSPTRESGVRALGAEGQREQRPGTEAVQVLRSAVVGDRGLASYLVGNQRKGPLTVLAAGFREHQAGAPAPMPPPCQKSLWGKVACHPRCP